MYFPKKPKLLVTAEVPGTRAIEIPLLTAFNEIHVILLGYRQVPDQTSPEQAREEWEEEAEVDLKKMEEMLAEKSVTYESRLIFTGKLSDTIKRVVEEEGCDALLALKPLDKIEAIVVPLYSNQQQPQHVASFVAAVVDDSDIAVRLRLLVDPEEEEKISDALLNKQRQAFEEVAISPEQIEIETIKSADPAGAIIDLASTGDVMVLGEADPSMREKIFGTVHEKIAPSIDRPLVLVLYKPDEEESSGEGE